MKITILELDGLIVRVDTQVDVVLCQVKAVQPGHHPFLQKRGDHADIQCPSFFFHFKRPQGLAQLRQSPLDTRKQNPTGLA